MSTENQNMKIIIDSKPNESKKISKKKTKIQEKIDFLSSKSEKIINEIDEFSVKLLDLLGTKREKGE